MPPVQGFSAFGLGGGAVELSFSEVPEATGYDIRFTSDASAGVADNQIFALAGANAIVVEDLEPGITYRFEIRAIDEQQQLGALGEPLFVVVDGVLSDTADAGAFPVFAQQGTEFSGSISIPDLSLIHI